MSKYSWTGEIMDILKLFNAGGFAMYPLLLCSILVWAIFIDKLKKLMALKNQTTLIINQGKNLILDNKIHEAKGLCHNMDLWIKAPYLEIFSDENHDANKEKKESRISRKLEAMKMELNRANWLLATIAAVAPFLGLLGTVTGIIRSFESIANSGKSGFSVIAPGLAEALITTAFGIIVAIMALIIFNYFHMKLKNLMTAYKIGLEDLIDELKGF